TSRLHAKTAGVCSIRYILLCPARLSFQFASLILSRQQPEQLRETITKSEQWAIFFTAVSCL
ncbi:MAG: hypothetical protein NTV69_01035, partial [Caldilinea sp.]|nr:hypothetical protein [Caldilinea sp.]